MTTQKKITECLKIEAESRGLDLTVDYGYANQARMYFYDGLELRLAISIDFQNGYLTGSPVGNTDAQGEWYVEYKQPRAIREFISLVASKLPAARKASKTSKQETITRLKKLRAEALAISNLLDGVDPHASDSLDEAVAVIESVMDSVREWK